MKSLFNSNDMEICFLANLWERARVCGVTHVDRSPIKVKLAFTLAEVLITLGIIGVVATMTIPTLMSKYQEKVYKTQYKEIFSELNQVMKSLEDDGRLPSSECTTFNDDCFRDLFATKLKVAHECYSVAPNNCQKYSKYLDGTIQHQGTYLNGSWPMFTTLKGYSIKFRYHIKDCSTVDEANWNSKENGALLNCGWVQVDTNGLSGPNIVGKDIFFLSLMQDGFIPFYTGDDKVQDCKKGTGISCSALYINNGGMDIDYFDRKEN